MLIDERIDGLLAAPASLIKTQGWKGVMRSLADEGRLVVTNHRQPEAVILSMAVYTELVRAAACVQDEPLQVLRARFDERLAALDSPDAGNRLRELMQAPAAWAGELKAGDTY